MAKKTEGEERKLQLVGGKKKPAAPDDIVFTLDGAADPAEQFGADVGNAMAAADQMVVLCIRGGYIYDVLALNQDRHSILGVLSEAYEVYQRMTTTEDE